MTNDTETTARAQHAISAGLHFAVSRVVATAELEGPTQALQWAESLLDDEELRAAFAAGIARELRSTGREARPVAGPGSRFRRRDDELEPEIPLLSFGGGMPR